ncbi:5-oxoprolinase subunit PxpB [Polaribacter gangjinensis]|uniref:Allophanate hydrolase n=1 Tax=Polaribacter gangjinensis TaxID=574710 RepID=A0A2S7WBR8_9FLAO|nr:5-oxoprolinase subunit PxpB [Polaribacter gangjinensis]PQJ75074.1 allophanate hydrolase [Polaribacter gangjinensis]
MHKLQYKSFGEKAILIEWQPTISIEILDDILQFKSKILFKKAASIADIIIGYHSLTIVYKTFISNHVEEVKILQSIYILEVTIEKNPHFLWEIPVCYEDEFGLDLEEISKKTKLSKSQIIQIHSEAIYTVFFIGFLPGFLYLGGLNSRLFIDRKSNPRLQIEKGSVAIGGKQTGIYPSNSPGGWNIIGKTPITFFDVENVKPCFASLKDRIHFVSVSKEEFFEIQEKVNNKTYQLQQKVIHD